MQLTHLFRSVHIPDFTEKLKWSEKSSSTDVISTVTRTQTKDGTGSKTLQLLMSQTYKQTGAGEGGDGEDMGNMQDNKSADDL